MKKTKCTDVPSVSAFYKPTVQALISLGGSGSIEELNEQVYAIMQLSDEVLAVPHNKDSRSKVDYRLAWARTRLKIAGVVENSSRGIWTLSDPDVELSSIIPTYIDRKSAETIERKHKSEGITVGLKDEEETQTWKDRLLEKLYTVSSGSFERLTQRILRESGFVQVEVTGRSGDGGIDGKGILRINGFLSFQILFQCKRHRGSVSASMIRDFRGAMQGRADKGLFITTGVFSRGAVREATRDGVPAIDLVDGELLCDKLKELELGVKTEVVESIMLELEWFDKI